MPSVEWFTAVERLHPGATELILHDFVEERHHQRAMQKEVLTLDASLSREVVNFQNRRIGVAGALALFLALCGLALILLDRALYGFVLLVAEIATLVGVFTAQRVRAIEAVEAESKSLSQVRSGSDEYLGT
ncbi:MAG TPA: hypothetical protein VI039_07435 [Solirubrobacterales bacterium]